MVDQSFPIIFHIDEQGVATVSLIGEFDADNHAALLHYLLGAVYDPAVTGVLVDMRATTFIDSSAIRAMEMGRAAALAEKKTLHAVDPQPSVRRIFEVLELDDLLADDLPARVRRTPPPR